VKVYANSFVATDSIKNRTNVEIEIKEAFKPSDFVLGNLFTQNNSRNLQSGGMVFISAKADSKELKLREGSEIGFIVPTDSLDEKMMIYQGERDSSEFMNWDSPESILNSRLRTLERSYVTITYQHSNDLNSNDAELSDWLWEVNRQIGDKTIVKDCLLYTSDAADDMQCVDLGGRRIIKKKNKR